MATPSMTFEHFLIAQGLLFRAELSYTGVAASGVVYTGILTGADEICVPQRSYSSSEASMQIDLFEATFTAGSDPRVFNRRLSITQVAPATVKQGVTPGTLGTAISSINLRAATAAGTTPESDDSLFYLKPNTSYVVRYSNFGSATATISNWFDFRKVLKGGWDGIIASA